MAKAKDVVIKTLNRTTWNLKTIPTDSDKLLQTIREKNQTNAPEKENNDGLSVLNHTGLKEITAYISFSGNILDVFLVTPSGIFYQFNLDVTSNDFDIEWWSFALRNYDVIVINSNVKNRLAELVNLQTNEISGSIIHRGKKHDNMSDISLRELFDIANSINPATS